eukprot:12923695-Prorocentrum_lima.AAC.1
MLNTHVPTGLCQGGALAVGLLRILGSANVSVAPSSGHACWRLSNIRILPPQHFASSQADGKVAVCAH